jgi:hypothetical protein
LHITFTSFLSLTLWISFTSVLSFTLLISFISSIAVIAVMAVISVIAVIAVILSRKALDQALERRPGRWAQFQQNLQQLWLEAAA